MPALYLILLLALLIIFNWRYLRLDRVFGSLGIGKRCKWRQDPVKKHDLLQRYICTTCGVDAFTSDGNPPRVCRRNSRQSGGL